MSQRPAQTRDQALWAAIRNRTKAIAFNGTGYKDFIDLVLCKREPPPRGKAGRELLGRELNEFATSTYGGGAYELLRAATQIFLLLECGVVIKRAGSFEEVGQLSEPVTLGEISERLVEYLRPT